MSPHRPTEPPADRYAFVVLALSTLVVFASLGLGRFGFSMVLPAMQSALDLTNTQTGELQSWNSLGYLLTVALAGALAARYGPRAVIGAALGIVGLAMLATGAWPSFVGASVSRFFAGVGGAAANVPAMALLAGWFTARRRGLAMGTAVAGSSLGLAVTGALVPVLLARFGNDGWRVCWYVFGSASLVVCLLCVGFLRNRSGRPTPGTPGKPEPAPGASPLNWGLVYRSRYVWKVATVYFAFGFSYSIFATFFVKHLVRDLSMTTAQAGAVWTRIGIASIVSGFIWGAISDRWGRRPTLVTIFVIQGIAFLLTGAGQSVALAVIPGGLFALTAWSIPAVVSALCGDEFGGRLAPAALGLVTVVFAIGQVLGPVVGGRLADSTTTFAAAFLVAGVVALVVGAGGALLLGPSEAKRGDRGRL